MTSVPIVPGASSPPPDLPPAPVPQLPEPPIRRRSRTWLVVVLVVLVLAVAGTASALVLRRGDSTPTTAATTPPPADGGEYVTPQALIAALGTRGVSCTGYEAVENPTGGALARGGCDIGTVNVVVSVFANHADALASPYTLTGLGFDLDFVIGRNWTINCSDGGPTLCAQIAAAIGGQVAHIPA